jgi:dihydrofolate synthase/folylpolyglutamate synthase
LKIRPAIERVRSDPKFERVTFFEMYTALALCYFRKRRTDFVILETGMGGRLDATNVAESLIAVITPVSLEHTHILGKTVGEIAKEKAGIIKSPSQKVVLAPQERDADAVLMERCRQFRIEPIRIDREHKLENVRVDSDRQIFDLATGKAGYGQLCLKLMGVHQRQNASAAVGAIECLQELGYAVFPAAVREGLRNAFWPCRFEVVKDEPLVILDGAHNGDSARALTQTVKEVYGGRKAILVFGVSEDKNETLILKEIEGLAREVIYAKADHPRAKSLASALSVRQALETARHRAGRDDIILVTGSIFLVSEARRELSALLRGPRIQCSTPDRTLGHAHSI